MSGALLKPGDRVDVTFRAVVVDWPGGKSSAVIRVEESEATAFPPSFIFPSDLPVSVEVLPPAEPDWWPPQVGDVVTAQGVSALPVVFLGRAWDRVGSVQMEAAAREGRATLLVRDGKPVEAPRPGTFDGYRQMP